MAARASSRMAAARATATVTGRPGEEIRDMPVVVVTAGSSEQDRQVAGVVAWLPPR